MIEDFKNKFDLSKRVRHYLSDETGMDDCPECKDPLIEEGCVVLISVKSDTDEGDFMSNLTGSCFCTSCPVVVFDSDKIEKAANLGIRGNKNISYFIRGIVNLNAIPQDKREQEIGTDENPMPLVPFLPKLDKINALSDKKIGRNDPCSCGSKKKYKKCCG